MRRAALLLLAFLVFAAESNADVEVRRHGAENPVVTVAKSTFWGGLAGLILGGAVALVAEENEDDIVKWFFVAGVFGGFGWGLYHVATREKPTTSLLEINGEGLALNMPTIQLRTRMENDRRAWSGSVTLLSVGF